MTQRLTSTNLAAAHSVGPPSADALSLELLAAFALCVTAGVHIADVSGKLEESTYIGLGFILGPIAAALLAAVLLIAGNRMVGWLIGAGVSGGTAVGYILSRTTGLPNARDDIGNWSEPIGVVSLIAEGAVILCLAVAAMSGGPDRSQG
jgi:hypothetical protein